MPDKAEIVNLFAVNMGFQPTRGQNAIIERLTEFLIDKEKLSLFVLKGYAGTGKTSLISALVKTLPSLGLRSQLLAPTGRAAKVLTSYSGKVAYTIHKKIYVARPGPDGGMVVTLQENLHENTLFIIDEASMIPDQNSGSGGSMFAIRNVLEDVMDYIYNGLNCRLLLVGDTAQLPPVGLNISPALDIEYLKAAFGFKLFTSELKEVVRQSIDSGILLNATKIREMITGNTISFPLFKTNLTDVKSITGDELEEALHYAYSNFGVENTIIITRTNKRAVLFNQEIRNRILFRDNELNAGDMLMVVRNNYFWLEDKSFAGFIANGDMIEVQRVKKTEELYGFRFAEISFRMIDYPGQNNIEARVLLNTLASGTASLPYSDEKKLFDEIIQDYQDIPSRRSQIEKVKNNAYFNALQIKFAYALTCHKTQGGQWQAVFIDQGYLTEEMIDGEFLRWLYTAVTRSTKCVYLVNFSEKYLH